MGTETRRRSIVKSLLYRLIAETGIFFIFLLWTGKTSTAAKITLLSFVYKTALYYSYERAWNLVNWGRGQDI